MQEINLFMDFSNPVFKLIIGLLLGAFVGLRREFDLQNKGKSGFRGLRTTALVSLLGVLSTLFIEFPYLPILLFMVWKGIKLA